MRCMLASFVGVLFLGFEAHTEPLIISISGGGPQRILVQQGTQPSEDKPKPGSAIRGRVLNDSGLPLRQAVVQASLLAPGTSESRQAVTDDQGQYEIRDLPAGRYWLVASKGAYVGLAYGQTRQFIGGNTVEVTDA